MRVLITGGGGFLGQKLARSLARDPVLRGQRITQLGLCDLSTPATIVDAPFEVTTCAGDASERAVLDELFHCDPLVVFHLAAVVSGAAEADFDLGMRVNLHGTLNLLEAARASAQRTGSAPVVVFTSSCAVHGGEEPQLITDGVAPNPQTSYGSQKVVGEMMLQDYSRRGYIDGRGLRLPSVTIRPGKPNAAASSFMSSIFREPLQGQTANCPVGRDYPIWHSAPRTVVANLRHAAELPAEAFGSNRNLDLTGRTDTVGDMLDAMARVAGPQVLERVTWNPDPVVQRIVQGWRGHFRTDKALRLGFAADRSFEDSVRWFLEDDIQRPG